MRSVRQISVSFAIVLIFQGCASMGTKAIISGPAINPQAVMIPTEILLAVKTIEIYDATQGKRVEADVLSLSSKDIRRRLTTSETLITIEKKDAGGSLNYLGAGGKVSKGTYRVTLDYANYTNQYITYEGTPGNRAIGRIGVGLRITAELTTTDNNIDLGGLLPISIAVQNKKVSGNLSFKIYGMSNDKVAYVVPTNTTLDINSIQQSFEAAATARVLFGLEDTSIEPYLIGVAGIQPSEAGNALEAATKQLTR